MSMTPFDKMCALLEKQNGVYAAAEYTREGVKERTFLPSAGRTTATLSPNPLPAALWGCWRTRAVCVIRIRFYLFDRRS